MTSENTSDTPCEHCPVKSGCPRGNPDADQVRAYRHGCRTNATRAAWNARARDYRAGIGVDPVAGRSGPHGSIADAWPVPAAKREPSRWSCGRKDCGEPLYWEPGFAGLSCSNGHWYADPKIRERIPTEKTREKTVAKKPDLLAEMKANSALRFRRDQLIRECDALLSGDFNPDNYPPENYYGRLAVQCRDQLLAIRPELVSANTPEMIDAGRQLLAEFLSSVQSYLAGMRTARQLKYDRENEYRLAGKVEYQDDEETEDYEDEDEDTGKSYTQPGNTIERRSFTVGYAPMGAAPQSFMSPTMAQTAYRMVAAREASEARRTRNGTCYFPQNHKGLFGGKVPTATRAVYGRNSNTFDRRFSAPVSAPIHICDSERCRAMAHAHFIRLNWQDTSDKELS